MCKLAHKHLQYCWQRLARERGEGWVQWAWSNVTWMKENLRSWIKPNVYNQNENKTRKRRAQWDFHSWQSIDNINLYSMLAAIKTILVRRSLITYNDSRIFLIFDVSVMQPNKLFVFPDHGKVTLLENRQRGLENNKIKYR